MFILISFTTSWGRSALWQEDPRRPIAIGRDGPLGDILKEEKNCLFHNRQQRRLRKQPSARQWAAFDPEIHRIQPERHRHKNHRWWGNRSGTIRQRHGPHSYHHRLQCGVRLETYFFWADEDRVAPVLERWKINQFLFVLSAPWSWDKGASLWNRTPSEPKCSQFAASERVLGRGDPAGPHLAIIPHSGSSRHRQDGHLCLDRLSSVQGHSEDEGIRANLGLRSFQYRGWSIGW